MTQWTAEAFFDAADILNLAANLLERPRAWTQGTDARKDNGEPVLAKSEHAVCWCVGGAIDKISGINGRISSRLATELRNRIKSKLPLGETNLGAWNDHPRRTQSEVVAMLREAAADAEAQS